MRHYVERILMFVNNSNLTFQYRYKYQYSIVHIRTFPGQLSVIHAVLAVLLVLFCCTYCYSLTLIN